MPEIVRHKSVEERKPKKHEIGLKYPVGALKLARQAASPIKDYESGLPNLSLLQRLTEVRWQLISNLILIILNKRLVQILLSLLLLNACPLSHDLVWCYLAFGASPLLLPDHGILNIFFPLLLRVF